MKAHANLYKRNIRNACEGVMRPYKIKFLPIANKSSLGSFVKKEIAWKHTTTFDLTDLTAANAKLISLI